MAEPQEPRERIAPWVSFSTFLTALQVLDQGLPEKIDKSVWRTLAFNVQASMISAFKFLQLIDEDGAVQPELKKFIDEPENRKELIRQLLEARYPKLVTLGKKKASARDLEDAIRELGVKGDDTVRKAIAFYRNAAQFSGVTLSPHWPNPKPGPRGSGGGRRSRKPRASKVVIEPAVIMSQPVIKENPFELPDMLRGPLSWLVRNGPSWNEDQARDWTQSFMRQVRLEYPPGASRRGSVTKKRLEVKQSTGSADDNEIPLNESKDEQPSSGQ